MLRCTAAGYNLHIMILCNEVVHDSSGNKLFRYCALEARIAMGCQIKLWQKTRLRKELPEPIDCLIQVIRLYHFLQTTAIYHPCEKKREDVEKILPPFGRPAALSQCIQLERREVIWVNDGKPFQSARTPHEIFN